MRPFLAEPRNGFDALAAARARGYSAIFCVTTNLERRQDGRAVMGAGVAREAVARYPGLDRLYGEFLAEHDHGFTRIGDLVMFPTKREWRLKSQLHLIADSACRLRKLILSEHIDFALLPPAGCGNGGLDWHGEVRPLLVSLLAPVGNRIIFCREPLVRSVRRV